MTKSATEKLEELRDQMAVLESGMRTVVNHMGVGIRKLEKSMDMMATSMQIVAVALNVITRQNNVLESHLETAHREIEDIKAR